MTKQRDRAADFWDEHIGAWIDGREQYSDDLKAWRAGYRGTGHGVVDLDCYPDPFVGDIRGVAAEPSLVCLGLNPGVGHPELQGRNPPGRWTRRIANEGYSRCFSRVPYEDAAWRALHGKDSPYWVRLVNFARRWHSDPGLTVRQILSVEMYPWHSRGLNGSAIRPPLSVVHKFVWAPIAEVDVDVVFAFSAQWLPVCEALHLKELAWYGPGRLHLNDPTKGKWNVRVFALGAAQRLVVSWQMGNSNPPGLDRIEELQKIVARHATK